MITSIRYKNTDKTNENSYENFILKTMKQIKKSWNKLNPGETLTEKELRTKAEDYCSMYRHHFRTWKVESVKTE